jgi:TolA-binding protein
LQQELWGDYVESIGADQILKDHENRIQTLEKNYDQMQRDIAQIQNGQLRIETTLLQESRDQKALLNQIIKQKFNLDKINTIGKWKLLIVIFGGSGLIYLIIDLIRSAFTK